MLRWLQSRGCRAGAVPGGQPSLSVTLISAETAATELQLSSSLLGQETFGTSLPPWGSCPLQESLRTSPSWSPLELRLHLQDASSTTLTWGSVCSLPSVLRCTPYFLSASLASLGGGAEPLLLGKELPPSFGLPLATCLATVAGREGRSCQGVARDENHECSRLTALGIRL